MKTKNMLLALMTTALLGASAMAQADGGWVHERRSAQREMIRDAVVHGDLTRREAKRLRGEQRRIARLERRLRTDGRLGRHDRRKLDRALDHAERRIARARHDQHVPHRGHRRARHGQNTTVINNHYEVAESEVVEASAEPGYNRSVELDLNGVRVIWSASGAY